MDDYVFPDNLPKWFTQDLQFLVKYEIEKNKSNVIRLWSKATGDQFPRSMTVGGENLIQLEPPSPAGAIHGRGVYKTPYLGEIVFHGVPDYIRFSKIFQGELFKRLRSLFISLPKITPRRLTDEEVVTLLFSTVEGYEIPLNAVDVSLLRLFSINSLSKQRMLATTTGFSKATLNRSLKKLKERCSMRITGVVNHFKVGLDNFFILSQNPLEYSSPYWSEINPLMIGTIPIYVYTFSPPLPFSKTLVAKVQDTSKPKGKVGLFGEKPKVLRVQSRRENINMRSYDLGRKSWAINWGMWTILLRDLYKEEGFPVSPSPLEMVWDKTQIDVEKKDLMLLDYLIRHPLGLRTPVRILASALSLSVWKVRQKLKKLLDSTPALVFPHLSLTNIGLNEHGAVFVQGEKAVKALSVSLLTLPNLSMYILEDIREKLPSLFAYLSLPEGGILNLIKSIELASVDLANSTMVFSSAYIPPTRALPLDYYIRNKWIA